MLDVLWVYGKHMTLVLTVIAVALVFEYINGFHDTANAIATTVSTKVLTPRQAIVLSTVFNLLGALTGTAVASTIGRGLVDTHFVSATTLIAALLAAIAWNLLTWWLGLPSSSSHALIGGLCGATLASAGSDWSVIRWSAHNPITHAHEGLWPKVVGPMFVSPICGILLGFGIMAALLWLLRNWSAPLVKRVFGRGQLLSAAWMSFSHGTNDAQKTMGIIALTLFTATTKTNAFDHLPSWLEFLRAPEFKVYAWIKVVCALTMAAGTAVGGWRIIRTLGHKMVKMQPIHGFAAQSTAAGIIQLATHWGIPLSTTHVISASIMGVGATKRLNAVKWSIVSNMVWAWILTIPVSGILAYGLMLLLRQVC
jgi:inorganic phosphate transporter, PiT family